MSISQEKSMCPWTPGTSSGVWAAVCRKGEQLHKLAYRGMQSIANMLATRHIDVCNRDTQVLQ